MPVIEVFKTDISAERDALQLCAVITGKFSQYQVNFDLTDCDRIMRVVSPKGTIETNTLIMLALELKMHIQPLPDEVPA